MPNKLRSYKEFAMYTLDTRAESEENSQRELFVGELESL